MTSLKANRYVVVDKRTEQMLGYVHTSDDLNKMKSNQSYRIDLLTYDIEVDGDTIYIGGNKIKNLKKIANFEDYYWDEQ